MDSCICKIMKTTVKLKTQFSSAEFVFEKVHFRLAITNSNIYILYSFQCTFSHIPYTS